MKVPPWIKFTVDPNVPGDRMAQYTLVRAAKPESRYNRDAMIEGGVTVNLRPDVLASDEAIVGTLTHELHELLNLDRMLEESDRMTYGDVKQQIAPNRGDNLHGQAWDVADLEVMLMREQPGTPKHKDLLARRTRLLEAFEQKNHGGR